MNRITDLLSLRSIRTRLLAAFIIVALLPVIITSIISNQMSARSYQNRLINQLESVTTLKEAEINKWVESLHNNLASLFSYDDLIRLNAYLAQKDQTGTAAIYSSLNHDKLFQQLATNINRSQIFTEIFVMDASGEVILSTDKAQEGKTFAERPLFQEGSQGKFVTPPFIYPAIKRYVIVVSQPLKDSNGNQIGTIAGRTTIEPLTQILSERAGLGQSGETFLVDLDHTLLTPINYKPDGSNISNQGIQLALQTQRNGSAEYASAAGKPVFAVYHYLPALQVALLAEQNRDESLAALNVTRLLTLITVLATLLLSVVMALIITRTIANPIIDLAGKTSEIAAGNLALEIPVTRKDEIGTLASAFNRMTGRLHQMVQDLEDRVAERTHDLERRTDQVKVAAAVARDITMQTELDTLLGEAVNLIRDRFGFYHAGIFLLDERGENAVLQAATGEAGRQMLDQRHKLKVGAVGIVGRVTGTGKPHIALDVGADAVHFKNPWLPDTRSEMAVSLKIGNRMIGALDVQSTQEAAFEDEDVTILQILADQLAVAIENARLIQQMNQTLRELQQAYGNYTQQAWSEFMRSFKQTRGYRFQQVDIQTANEQRPEASAAMDQAKTIEITLNANAAANNNHELGLSALAVPIKVREQVIGVLNMRLETESIPQETLLIVEEIAARLALVLENTRLLQEAQRMVQREQQINLISTQMRSSIDTETILRNTVRELGKALGTTRTYISIDAEQFLRLESSQAKDGNGHQLQVPEDDI